MYPMSLKKFACFTNPFLRHADLCFLSYVHRRVSRYRRSLVRTQSRIIGEFVVNSIIIVDARNQNLANNNNNVSGACEVFRENLTRTFGCPWQCVSFGCCRCKSDHHGKKRGKTQGSSRPYPQSSAYDAHPRTNTDTFPTRTLPYASRWSPKRKSMSSRWTCRYQPEPSDRE